MIVYGCIESRLVSKFDSEDFIRWDCFLCHCFSPIEFVIGTFAWER
jgi:hypothetical protein